MKKNIKKLLEKGEKEGRLTDKEVEEAAYKSEGMEIEDLFNIIEQEGIEIIPEENEELVKPESLSGETGDGIGRYLQEIGKTPLLSAEEEREYGRKINKMEGEGTIGIIANGVSYQYVKEIGPLLGVKTAKLNMTYPISREFVANFIRGLRTLIVVEELEPVVEDFVRAVAKDVNPKLKIHGKE